MNLLCRLLGHRRSAGRAYVQASHWKSYCKRCGVPMIRLGKGHWKAAKIHGTIAK